MFDTALPIILGFEGGYSNDPDDPGKATNFGVIQSTYDSFRRREGLSERPVKEIDPVEVSEIYRSYYDDCYASVFDTRYPILATAVFDCAINCGTSTASRILQRALNNFGPKEYLKVDGVIGSKTLAELYTHKEEDILKEYLNQRRKYYTLIMSQNIKLVKFRSSWFHRLNKLAALGNIAWRADDKGDT